MTELGHNTDGLRVALSSFAAEEDFHKTKVVIWLREIKIPQWEKKIICQIL